MYNFRSTEQRTNYLNGFKRKLPSEDSSTEHNKKLRTNNVEDWSKWVSATETRAFMLKDQLLDWLHYHHIKFISSYPTFTDSVMNALRNKNTLKESNVSPKGITSEPKEDSPRENSSENSFTSFIMGKGKQFESHVVDILKNKFQNNFVDIDGNGWNARSYNKMKQTMDEIYNGTPLIFSGVLWDYENKTYGVPDIIVRSDWLSKFIILSPLNELETIKHAPKLNGSYHYVIIDIKFKTLNLRCNGIHILNEGMVPCYKSQTFIYNRALADIQGYNPKKTFILGRKWKFTSKGDTFKGNTCFDRLGVIDFSTIDTSIEQETNDAVKWILDVRQNGDKWDPLAKNHPNLYPNMANTYDFPWSESKKRIADQIKEITQLWMCNTKNRAIAHKNNVFEWSDPKCTTDALGVNGPVTKKILNEILKINHQQQYQIMPLKIKNNIGDWQTQYELEFYVDFETVNDVVLTDFKKLPKSETITILFQIGVGYIDPSTSKWKYISFMVNDLTKKEEYKICKAFVEFINEKSGESNPPLFHWSSAEPNIWQNIIEKYVLSENVPPEVASPSGIPERDTLGESVSKEDTPRESVSKEDTLGESVSKEDTQFDWDMSWVDMLKVFKGEPIVIKNIFDFSLKSIAKQMHKYNMIDSTWTSNCSNGATAMIAAYKAQKDAKERNVSMKDTSYMKDIEKYNEIDCKTIYEIVNYLRMNHI